MRIDGMMWDIDLRDAAAYGRKCEAIGLDALWSFEAAHNPFMPLAQVAAATERINIGTNIAVAFARSPYATAQAAWDLQAASDGRFQLGLGTQVRAHVERRFSMPFDRPAARLTDYIRCLRAIWDTFQTDARPSYEGEFYRFLLTNPAFNPGPIDHPAIPIWIAGVNPRMCRVAGEAADGMHVHPMHSVSYLREVVRPAVTEGAVMSGRRVEDIAFFASVFAVAGDSEEERRSSEAQVRDQIGFYAATPSYRALLEHHGHHALGKELSQMVREGRFDEVGGKVPDSLLAEVAVSGSPAEIARILADRYPEGLLQRAALYFAMPMDAPEDQWQAFVETFRATLPTAAA